MENSFAMNWAGFPAGLCYQDENGIWHPLNADSNGNLQVSLTGILPAPDGVPNTLIGTVGAASIPSASTWYYPVFNSKLTRTAKSRVISIASTLNQQVTVKLGVYDSILKGFTINIEAFTGTIILSPNTGTTFGSNYDPLLTEPVDSLMVAVQTGATPPSTGELAIYLTERFN